MNIVYVYAKDKKIKVLPHDTALKEHNKMLADGWKHTNTINPCAWIENLYYYSDTPEFMTEIVNNLSKQFRQ